MEFNIYLIFFFAELLKDPVSLKEILDMWTDLFKQRVAMACFRENSTELVGVNMVYVTTKDEKDDYESKVNSSFFVLKSSSKEILFFFVFR